MKPPRCRLLTGLLAALLLAGSALASPLAFRDDAEQARFHALAAELRCVQCHNQSLADSDALIAQDMRRQVLALMQQGHTDAQIRDYLVQRYGQFVLYRPALGASTLALWLLPALLLLAGGWLLLRVIGRRQALLDGLPPTTPPSGGDAW